MNILSKRAMRAAKTQQKLRQAAAAVFARNGFYDTKISDIVAEAQVSQPTFYLYYTSKEAAFESLVGEFRQSLQEATQLCLISPGLTPDELFADLCISFNRYFQVLTADRALTEIGFFHPQSGEETKIQMIEWIKQNMASEQQAGILRTDIAVHYQARMVVGLLDQMARIPESEKHVDELAQVCARLFCDALSVSQQRQSLI